MENQIKNIILNNGVAMPMLGLGVFRLKDEREAMQSVQMALEVGYRHIDTAAVYENEAAVGRAIKDSGLHREDIFVTTKLAKDHNASEVEAAFQASLDALKMDYVDLYLIHWPMPGKYQHIWPELEKIYKSGRARAIGVSNFHTHHIEEIKKNWEIIPAINQIERHPYLNQKALMDYCQSLGITVEAWSPLGAAKNDLLVHKEIQSLADKYHKTTAQIIIRWNIDAGVVVIPKSSNLNRLQENLNVFDFALTDSEMKQMDELNQNVRVGRDPDTL